MQKLLPILITAFLLSAGLATSFAQMRKIPSEVTEAFKQKYPDATNVEWRDKLSNFTAVFESDHQQYEAKFSSKGQWQLTENEIDDDELPEVVKDSYDKSKYAEWEIRKVQRIEFSDGGVQYRIESIKNDVVKKNLYFNNEGRLLKDKITI
jgi:Putative beta-lactamase-inhibitor-like, PepSY-like